MLQIAGSGRYLPRRVVSSIELDEKTGSAAGTFEKASGVKQRHYADHEETASYMGALAAMAALEDAKMKFSEIDLILGASGTQEQSIPCNAALIQRALGQENSGVPCFDVNSTCLSFVTAFQVAASLIECGTYRNILIVSSDIASVGLNYQHLESASLFGDGAAAFVIGKPDKSFTRKPSQLLAYHMETYSSGWDTCQITGGGTSLHPSKLDWRLTKNDERFLFSMNGPKVFRMASKLLPSFIKTLSKKSGIDLVKDAKMMIPHQASDSAMELIRRKLDLGPGRMYKIIAEHGNMIAASIPLALHYALKRGDLVAGDIVFLVGTSAGFSIGGLVLRI